MKLKSIFTLLLATATLSSCQKDFNELHVPQDELVAIQLSGEINQVATSRVNDEGFCDGDGVGVYVVNYSGETAGTLLAKGNQADNAHFVFAEAENKWVPDYPIYYYDKMTPVDIIGYYPYASNIEDVNTYSFEVAKDQSIGATNGVMGGYEASDFLWGKTEKIAPTTSRVNITFHHRMAGVQVELVEGTGFDENEWSGLDKQVLVTNTIRKATINLANGEVTSVGEVPTTGTIPAVNGGGWRAVVVPQCVGASVALFNITVDGTSYIFRKNEGFEYISGKLHKFTIEVSKKSASGLEFKLIGEAITAWESETITHDGTAREYVVINVPKASTDESSALKAAIETSGKDYTKIKNLKVTGEVNANDFYFMRDEMSSLQGVNMKEVTITPNQWGEGANEIPFGAFSNKSTLTRYIFPEGVTDIGENAFSGTTLTGSLILPRGIKHIGAGSFSGLPLTGSLMLPESVEYIGASAFHGCQFHGRLHLSKNLKHIGAYSFYQCEGLNGELILPESLESIGVYAFQFCAFTGDLIIPHKIKQINAVCFANCGFSGKLILHDEIKIIDNGAFGGNNFNGELTLPVSLIKIGNEAFRNNRFSGVLVLPENISSIGDLAFANNHRLTGVVEIPKNMTVISSETFAECSQLEGVILHENIEFIERFAFGNCFQLKSIVSKAYVPPILDASVFDGVAKDNFVVEVPEASVADYTLAPNWNEFKRIAAYREFSISRNLFRTLNAEDSKTLILRAESGAAWRVESKPDWITITPSSGMGKTEVTITVNEMAAGNVGTFNVEVRDDWGNATTQTYNGRSGEVVFLLDGKDYRTRTKVEQYDYEYADGDVITNQTATIGNGVNIVFMGDCFDAQDIATGKYLNSINEAIGHFFAVEPYRTYRDYFNVYAVFGLSPDSGMGTVNTIREAKFGSQYMLNEGVQTDGTVCFEYACKTPTVTKENIHQTTIVLIENSYEYAGITQMWDDGSAIAMCPMSVDEYPYDYRGLVQHEAGGHAFGKLGDEYIYENAFLQTCTLHYPSYLQAKSLDWFRNLDDGGNMHNVPWSHLIFDEKYQNTVDIYEGGYMHTRGCFRSEPNSCMNNNIPYFSAISRQAIVERIMEYAGEEFSFEAWKAKDKGLATDEPSAASRSSAPRTNYVERSMGQQQPPKFMGEKPVLNF